MNHEEDSITVTMLAVLIVLFGFVLSLYAWVLFLFNLALPWLRGSGERYGTGFNPEAWLIGVVIAAPLVALMEWDRRCRNYASLSSCATIRDGDAPEDGSPRA